MPTPDPTVQLRPFRGQLEPERPVLELRAGIWDGKATVRPLQWSGKTKWQVSVAWEGPRMDGFPTDDRRPGQNEDIVVVDELELARRVAHAAIDDLKHALAPDLRAVVRKLKERR